ncbi:DUF4419 domain-containing protein [Streptomyces sp. NPDC006739]|uniref:DUF4419 domain-containing protein n=1 Tax=Streptomyces sp. NPDC006739 TaxID=3364763 RepID=UPI0036C0C5BE
MGVYRHERQGRVSHETILLVRKGLGPRPRRAYHGPEGPGQRRRPVGLRAPRPRDAGLLAGATVSAAPTVPATHGSPSTAGRAASPEAGSCHRGGRKTDASCWRHGMVRYGSDLRLLRHRRRPGAREPGARGRAGPRLHGHSPGRPRGPPRHFHGARGRPDWRLLAGRVRELEGWFEGLRPWFAALHPVLDSISAAASGWGIDQKFWRSLYKWESASGGDRVTGWITAFFAHRYTDEGPLPKQSFGPGTTEVEDFPSRVSRVPFRWETPTGTRAMAFLGGVLGTERDGEWIRPCLGYAVVELLPAAEPHDERLPEPWTTADVRRVTGCPEAQVLTTLGTVTLHGEPLQADCAIDVKGLRGAGRRRRLVSRCDLVSDSGDIECWGNYGPDLGYALRSL